MGPTLMAGATLKFRGPREKMSPLQPLLTGRQTDRGQPEGGCVYRETGLGLGLLADRQTDRQTEGRQRAAVRTVRLGSLSSRLVLSTQ